MSYNLKDPQDTQRFQINLMLADVGLTITDYAARIGLVTEPHVATALVDFTTAVEHLNRVTAPKDLDGTLRIQPKLLLQPITLVGSIRNAGDGSAYVAWFATQDEANYDQDHLDQGWGERCTVAVQTYEGSKIWFNAIENSRDQREQRR